MEPIPLNENWRQLLFLYRAYKLVQNLRIAFESTERNFKRDWQKYIDDIGRDPLALVWNLKQELKPKTIVGPAGKEANIWSENYWASLMMEALQNNRTYLEYLQYIYGFQSSPIQAAGLLGMIGDQTKFKGLRSLWHYCGLHNNEKTGRAPKLSDYKKGMKRDYNSSLRTLLCGNIGKTLIRKNSIYRSNYEEYRILENERHDWKTCESCQEVWKKTKKKNHKLHPFMRAKRKVVKKFVKDLWNYWQENSHKAQANNVSQKVNGFPAPNCLC